MFTLQECSICFEDFDNERSPHNIPCGHVFCRPCLESLVSTPNCPNCRTAYTPDSIRKVVCSQQDASPPSGAKESEEETLMWQAIQSAVETSKEYEQRKTLVRHNSPESVREAGMSPHLLIALDVLQMLVKVEQKNDTLKEKVDTARAVEESLCDRISMLEAQLSAKTGETSTNSHEIRLLLAQVRAIQTAVQHVKTDTSAIIDRLNTESRTPVPPPTPVTPDASPNHTLRASTSKPSLLRKTSPPTPTTRAGPSQDRPPPQYVQKAPDPSPPQRQYLLPHDRMRCPLPPKHLMSPPMTPPIPGKPLFVLDPPMTPRWEAAEREDVPVPATPNPQSPRAPVASSSTIYQPPPAENLKPIPTPISTSSPANPFRSPKSPILSPTTPKHNFNSMPVPTVPSSFNQPSKPALTRRLTTTHPYKANTPTELTFGPNQTLHLLPESDMSPGKDWVWCKADDGSTGYAPRSYLQVE